VRTGLANYLPLILAAAWVVLGVLAGIAIDRILLNRAARSRVVANSLWLSVSVEALRGVAIVWGTIAGLYAATVTINMSPRLDFLIGRLLLVLVLASGTLVAARFAAGAVGHFGDGVERKLLSASLFASIAQIVVIVFGARKFADGRVAPVHVFDHALVPAFDLPTTTCPRRSLPSRYRLRSHMEATSTKSSAWRSRQPI